MKRKNTKQICIKLRRKGLTLGEIVKITKLPKTTIYHHIDKIPLPTAVEKRVKREAITRLNKFSQDKKGKCIPGRVVLKPQKYTNELIFLIAHFMFDGDIYKGSCSYQNRSKELIDRTRDSMKNLFNLTPYYKFYKDTEVHRISYHYIELADYFRGKFKELKQYIKTASLPEKKIFIQAFFDDEGCAYKWNNIRKVRGYQYDLETLNLIHNLLNDFDIKNRIEEKGKEIVISKKENLVKFRDKINFSKGIYINPNRKNSIWKKKLEKRKILDIIINSYNK
jgi:hypothetical protein